MHQRKPILLAQDTITAADFDRLSAWLKTYPRLTKGQKTIDYEQQWAKEMGTRYAVFVNSGSSANLLMIYALIVANRLKNKKVVVPALSWITDISPVIQFGLDPVLCDCNMEDLSIDLEHLKMIFETQDPAVLILVPVLGLVPDMQSIRILCNKHNVILLVDNCEGQGSKFSDEKPESEVRLWLNKGFCLETYGLMASCSTYFGHILSTIEGGMITTDDEELYNLLKMLRSHGWSRDIDETRKQELQKKYNTSDFNTLYTFYHPAFNVRSTDLQAFIGIEQLKRLGQVSVLRSENYKIYYDLIHNDFWKQKDRSNVFISNLGFPVIHPNRDKIVKELQDNQVEVRPLISGSMGTQPFFVDRYGRQELPNVAIVDKYGFYLPNHPYLSKEDIEFVCSIVNKHTAEEKILNTDVSILKVLNTNEAGNSGNCVCEVISSTFFGHGGKRITTIENPIVGETYEIKSIMVPSGNGVDWKIVSSEKFNK